MHSDKLVKLVIEGAQKFLGQSLGQVNLERQEFQACFLTELSRPAGAQDFAAEQGSQASAKGSNASNNRRGTLKEKSKQK